MFKDWTDGLNNDGNKQSFSMTLSVVNDSSLKSVSVSLVALTLMMSAESAMEHAVGISWSDFSTVMVAGAGICTFRRGRTRDSLLGV